VVGRNGKRNAGVADLPLGADEPLGKRGLGNEEGAGDLGRGEPSDHAQGERNANVGREGWMGAGEHESEAFVGE
jgi:hypothetical protein